MSDLYDGYKWRDREEKTWSAWLTANIINATGRFKRPFRAKDLLPRTMSKPQSIDEIQRELAEKQKRFEAAAAKRGHRLYAVK